MDVVWGILKRNVKNGNPKNYDELKKFHIEELSEISPDHLKRIKKCIEIQGSRLEDYCLNQIKKEIKKSAKNLMNTMKKMIQ